MTLLYRPAVPADIPALTSIRNGVEENRLLSTVMGPQDDARALWVEGRGWVCEGRGQVLGFVRGRPTRADVWALFLRATHHGQGIGNALLAWVEEFMFRHGVLLITLHTEPGTPAHRLHQRRGCQRHGVTPTSEVSSRCLPREWADGALHTVKGAW